jgi:aspartate ammonia-lyase
MPGKVNPVIPEAVSQAAMVVMANDQLIGQACAMGHLELNPFLPVIADALLGSLDLLTNACRIFRRYCVEHMTADEERCRQQVENSTASVTALVGLLGYQQATDLAQAARTEGKGLRQLAIERGLITAETFDELISPESVTRLGTPVVKDNR